MIFSWKENRIKRKNRKRFKEIISDERHNYLEAVFRKFKEGESPSDIQVKEAYNKFSASIQTNTIAAAQLEFVIVATIAVYKPNLIEELLFKPFLLVVYSFGNEVNCETVIIFVENYILNNKIEPYGGVPEELGEKWLKQYFKNNKATVEKILKDVIKWNNEDLERL